MGDPEITGEKGVSVKQTKKRVFSRAKNTTL